MKTIDETNVSVIKQELDIGPTVLQTQIMSCLLPPSKQALPHIRHQLLRQLGLLPLCTVFAEPALKGEDEYYKGSLGDLSNSSSMKNMKRIDNSYRRVLGEKQCYCPTQRAQVWWHTEARAV
ncbi:hypothetical protein EVAR_83186_1 [Eumeta japonica]|uniref:Uncharacterized protein n=1 Tax=Eumeta variegata TaxID=151549 RepID=A0A4C1YP54_EUMVA|nr:hypothetical protein EVAR_83186_1 [Eumeta japonica]